MWCYIAGATIAIVLGLGGCSTPNEPDFRKMDTTGLAVSTDPLNPAKPVIVSVPSDGVYHQKSYAGSGLEVARRTAAAFSRYAGRVEIVSGSSQGRDDALRAARNANAGYLIIPTIIHWEPRVTEWALIPAQVDVNLTVTNLDTAREVRSTLLEGRSSRSAFATSTLEAMYSSLLDGHVAELYGVKAPISQR